MNILRLNTGKVLGQYDISEEGEFAVGVRSVAFSPDGRHVPCVKLLNYGVIKRNAKSKCVLSSLKHGITISCGAITPNGRRALCGGFHGELWRWDMATGQQLSGWNFNKYDDHIRAVSISPDGRRSLSGHHDGTVRMVDLEAGQELLRLNGHIKSSWFSVAGGGVYSVTFAADGRLALSGGADKTVCLWDLTTGEALRRFEGHTGKVYSVAFSRDGRRALSSGADKTVRLWDIMSGRELHCFKGHTDKVECVAFSPDGRRALTGGDWTLRLWALPA